jgi:glucan biosynthesis protein C
MFFPIGTSIEPIGKVVAMAMLFLSLCKTARSICGNTIRPQQAKTILYRLVADSAHHQRLFYHIGMIFNVWPWHIKNEEQFRGVLWYVMVFMSKWRMPLLFLIAGAGTWFAFGRRTAWQFLNERRRRLLIPLGVGILFLVPVQVYIERTDQYESLLHFYPHMFDGIYPEGNFSWHHLWFVAYLFVISAITLPLLQWLRKPSAAFIHNTFAKFMDWPLSLNLFVVLLLLSELALRPFFPENTHALINDWAAISYYIIFFVAGYLMLSNPAVVSHLRRFRFWYAAEASLAAIVMFGSRFMGFSPNELFYTWGVAEKFVAWSSGMTAIGFAIRYLNFDSKWRKLANEAIYPFYLLHQPVIIIVGYFALQWGLPLLGKIITITVLSLVLTVGIYWYLVRPYTIIRVGFGMKSLKKAVKVATPEPNYQES